MFKNLLEKEKVMSKLFHIDPRDEADYILEKFESELTYKEICFIQEYRTKIKSLGGFLNSKEQALDIRTIHSFIGFSKDDWEEYDPNSCIIPKQHIESYFNSHAEYKFEDLSEFNQKLYIHIYCLLYKTIMNLHIPNNLAHELAATVILNDINVIVECLKENIILALRDKTR